MTTNEVQLRCPSCDEQLWTITTCSGAVYPWRCPACDWEPADAKEAGK
jgi:predicted RNA-binding Zn-ribbon protein involved in translation (DUF1610 family)